MTSSSLPFVNSWTEWGPLELVCVGRVDNSCYPNQDPWCYYNYIHDTHLAKYASCLGARPKDRLLKAASELQNLVDIIEGEQIETKTLTELDEDIQISLARNRGSVCGGDTREPTKEPKDRLIVKDKSKTIRPSVQKFDHLLMTPWFTNYYQFSMACPRDMIITLGNTLLEAPTGSRVRYFESSFYRDLIMPIWKSDKRVHWKKAPQPTCSDSMFKLGYPFYFIF
eukprot:TRINITY_DN11768_c0_g1_i1.p1 TRINITY_DN11768_c0_g1~~TRINITY_DN11768_c0_g1_i1.p1  ORF type:complete len:225 (-),score=17.04 TRINITY_DN11768_c0_g1_i1:426-1100(-)